MAAATSFRKALMQLDYGKQDEAIGNLRTAIDEASNENDDVTKYGAMCCLGDVLVERGEINDARPLLEEVAALVRNDDVLDNEQERARELLGQL